MQVAIEIARAMQVTIETAPSGLPCMLVPFVRHAMHVAIETAFRREMVRAGVCRRKTCVVSGPAGVRDDGAVDTACGHGVNKPE